MKLTGSEKRQKREFLLRHREQEGIYYLKFRAILNRQYRNAAKKYEETGLFDPSSIQMSDLEPTYRRLYTVNTIREASIEWSVNVLPLLKELRKSLTAGMQTKDLIDDLAELLGFNNNGRIISVWRELLEDYLNIRILTRIQNVTNTTRDRIARIIEQGVNEGMSSQDIARRIRNEARLNRVRSRAIARTEITSAMNQGKYLAVSSSNLQYQKIWSNTIDNRTRNAHLAMTDANAIDLIDDFIVGGEYMAYPGDVRASARNLVNCRCVLAFQVKRDSRGRPIRKSELIQQL